MTGLDLLDLAFPLTGRALPRDHGPALAAALTNRLPWLGLLPGTGMHRLHLVTGGGAELLLSGRTRLVLRVPRDRADETAALEGLVLEVGAAAVRLGPPTRRELLPHRTLYAHCVAAPPGGELDFLAMVEDELAVLGVAGRPICGRRQEGHGYSLMVDGLSPEHALSLLRCGIGAQRALGCGIFVPHRSAAAVGA